MGQVRFLYSKSKFLETFKKRILIFIRPKMDSIYNIHDPLGTKPFTKLRTGFSHLKEHKCKHNFRSGVSLQ